MVEGTAEFQATVAKPPLETPQSRPRSGKPAGLTLAQKRQFLVAAFDLKEATQKDWPGLQAYLRYLEGQFRTTASECFRPLCDIFGYAVPITPDDLLKFVTSIVKVFRDSHNEALSIDEVLESTLPVECRLSQLDHSAADLSRQAVFRVLSWLTMIFEASDHTAEGRFQISVPLKGEGIREEQLMDNARRPISRLIRGFGQLLPTTDQVSAAIEKPSPDFIYSTHLNVYSLKLIDKIQIEWTNSIGCHLMFSPLSRTLTLYRFPSFCAMTCAMDTDGTALDK